MSPSVRRLEVPEVELPKRVGFIVEIECGSGPSFQCGHALATGDSPVIASKMSLPASGRLISIITPLEECKKPITHLSLSGMLPRPIR